MKNMRLYGSGKTLHSLVVQGLLLILAGARICSAGQSQPQLQISSPPNNTIAAPGQTLSFNVTSPAGLAFSSVGVSGENPFDFSDLATSVPAQFSFTVPATLACRRYRFTAAGTTTSAQNFESIAVFIDVERPDAPLSLESDISSIMFKNAGERHRLQLIATFADGTSLDVSESTYISFISSNANIATVDQHGAVTAVATGTAYITAIYTIGTNKTQLIVPVTMGTPSGTGITSSGTFSLSVSPGQQTIIPGNSATFQVAALAAPWGLVEIEVIAVKSSK